jgi:hypothetical protein
MRVAVCGEGDQRTLVGVIEQMLWFSDFLGSNVDEGGCFRRLVMKGCWWFSTSTEPPPWALVLIGVVGQVIAKSKGLIYDRTTVYVSKCWDADLEI